MLEHHGDIFIGKLKAKELINALNDLSEDTEVYFFSHSLFPHIDNQFYCLLETGLSWFKDEIIPRIKRFENG